jgi:hypothetical protein
MAKVKKHLTSKCEAESKPQYLQNENKIKFKKSLNDFIEVSLSQVVRNHFIFEISNDFKESSHSSLV